jgi:RNA polymerase sigma-54 factor
MGLENKLLQKMGQSLLMTPQLQQAIKLLQLGRLEYQEAIERELLENPFLEEMPEGFETRAMPSPPDQGDSATTPTVLSGPLSSPDTEEPQRETTSAEPRADWDDYADSFTDYQGSASAKGNSNFDDRQPPEVVSTHSESLEQHLLRQVRLQDFSALDSLIARNIAGNLNRDGLLECSYEELADACSCAVEDVAAVADMLRFFDPVGCCTPFFG